MWAFHLDDGSDVPGWPRTASYETTFLSAPALGDIDGDGRIDVVVGTNRYARSTPGNPPSGGAVDVFYGDRAKVRRTWVSPDVEIVAPPVIADVTGEGTPEVLVSTASQVFALGSTLAVVQDKIATSPHANRKSAAAVGRIGDGWGIVSTGFDGDRDGWVQVHDIAAPTSLPWPMHRGDAARRGVNVTPPPLPASGFYDVPDSSFYAPAVTWAVDAGVTTGCTPTRFCPSDDVTRAHFATFLWRLAGRPEATGPQFADVPADAYYADAVRWVRDEGITGGCSASSFCPNAPAARAHLVTFLWRHAGEPNPGGEHGFDDVPEDAYYEDAVAWASEEGITKGTSADEFSPKDPVSRGQTVVFLHRYAR